MQNPYEGAGVIPRPTKGHPTGIVEKGPWAGRQCRPRGARPTPRARWNDALKSRPHKPIKATPASLLVVPSVLSYWLNNMDGDCVLAEEAAKLAACGILISDATVQTFGQQNDLLNGADLDQVLQLMETTGFVQDGNMYNDGPATAVDYTTLATLQNAIAQGPVKLGVAADQLENVVGTTNGWFGIGFTADANEDHCISALGFATISELAQWLNVTVPSGVDGSQPGIAVETWNTIGIMDVPSFLAITAEAWLRSPNTVIVGTGTPTPDAVTVFGGNTPTPTPNPKPSPTPTPTPLPTPSGSVTLTTSADLPAGTYQINPAGSVYLSPATVALIEADLAAKKGAAKTPTTFSGYGR